MICETLVGIKTVPKQNWNSNYSQEDLEHHLLKRAAAHARLSGAQPLGKRSLFTLCEYIVRGKKPTISELKATVLPDHLIDTVTCMDRVRLNNMTQVAAAKQDLSWAAYFLNSIDSMGHYGIQSLVIEAKKFPQTKEDHKALQHRVTQFIYLTGTTEAADPHGELAQAKHQFEEVQRKNFEKFKQEHPGATGYTDTNQLAPLHVPREAYLAVYRKSYSSADAEAIRPPVHAQWTQTDQHQLRKAIITARGNLEAILKNNPPPSPGW